MTELAYANLRRSARDEGTNAFLLVASKRLGPKPENEHGEKEEPPLPKNGSHKDRC